MSPDIMALVDGIIVPAASSLWDLGVKLANGIVSLTTARSELRNILLMAHKRLDDADLLFAARDKAEDERLQRAQLDTSKLTKP